MYYVLEIHAKLTSNRDLEQLEKQESFFSNKYYYSNVKKVYEDECPTYDKDSIIDCVRRYDSNSNPKVKKKYFAPEDAYYFAYVGHPRFAKNDDEDLEVSVMYYKIKEDETFTSNEIKYHAKIAFTIAKNVLKKEIKTNKERSFYFKDKGLDFLMLDMYPSVNAIKNNKFFIFYGKGFYSNSFGYDTGLGFYERKEITGKVNFPDRKVASYLVYQGNSYSFYKSYMPYGIVFETESEYNINSTTRDKAIIVAAKNEQYAIKAAQKYASEFPVIEYERNDESVKRNSNVLMERKISKLSDNKLIDLYIKYRKKLNQLNEYNTDSRNKNKTKLILFKLKEEMIKRSK